MLLASLNKIFDEYTSAKNEALKGHPLANHITFQAKEALIEAIGESNRSLLVAGSPGQGNWATVPWLAVFDPLVTPNATRGYYVVLLFHSERPIVHLSLNQGATAVIEEFGFKLALDVLKDRAAMMRARLPDYEKQFGTKQIELGSNKSLPRAYEAGHIIGVSYSQDKMPSEGDLARDLRRIIEGYLALTFRGGIEPSIEAKGQINEDELSIQMTLMETRRYRMHKKIERNSTASKAAKKIHGHRCQACDLDFTEAYGEIGKGYIEAHHLKPMSSLEEGKAVEYNVEKDFAVLCANCHRMIHRYSNPGDLDAFRKILYKKL